MSCLTCSLVHTRITSRIRLRNPPHHPVLHFHGVTHTVTYMRNNSLYVKWKTLFPRNKFSQLGSLKWQPNLFQTRCSCFTFKLNYSLIYNYLQFIHLTLRIKFRYLTGKISGDTSPICVSCPLTVPCVLGLASSNFVPVRGVPASERVTVSLSRDLPDRDSCRNLGIWIGGRGE